MNGRGEARALPVFVYGTLRRGQINYGLLRGRTVAEYPAILPAHTLHYERWPYVVPGCRGDQVVGELMVVSPGAYADVLASLDQLEGFCIGRPSDYVRVSAPVRYRHGAEERAAEAWVYVAGGHFKPSPTTLVTSGDWLTFQSRRHPHNELSCGYQHLI